MEISSPVILQRGGAALVGVEVPLLPSQGLSVLYLSSGGDQGDQG